MAIASPRRRLALHCKPKFVTTLFARTGRRSPNASLSLTSMIDFLIVVVVTNAADVPFATNTSDLLEAATVSVLQSQVILEGVLLGNTHEIEDAQGGLRQHAALREALKAKRETWKQAHPGHEPPGAVVLQVEQDAPARVVKSIFLTATRAGFPETSASWCARSISKCAIVSASRARSSAG